MIEVYIEPEGETRRFERLNTVLQLLNRLELDRSDALVIRGERLLTPDVKFRAGDRITVRKVTSRG
jgi:hypothetical protein